MKTSLFITILLISLTSILTVEYYPACASHYSSIVDALQSIGVDSSKSNRSKIAAANGISNYVGSAEQNIALLKLLKQGKLIKPGSDPTPSPTPSKDISISKLVNHPKFSSKGETLSIIGNILVNRGYEGSFIAGVLANIFHEGAIGKFESSAYITNPSAEPQYLRYMDELYDYRNKYSNKIITQVSMNELGNVLNQLRKASWKKGKFGLGCVQWTGSRTYDLFKLYLKENNYGDRITLDQATSAEGKMIITELRGNYQHVYNQWKSNNPDYNTPQAAYNAGHIMCMKYEIPADTENKANKRGATAKEMYNIMTS